MENLFAFFQVTAIKIKESESTVTIKISNLQISSTDSLNLKTLNEKLDWLFIRLGRSFIK